MGIFDAVSEFFGTKNEEKATPFQQTSNYNPNAFQYGGREGGADQAAAGYGLMGRQAQARGGVGINAMQADQARFGQNQAAGLMMGRATGAVPSIAGMQAAQDAQRAVAAQASAAASARGPAALAMAQQNAAANTANAQSAISGQAQINSANERLQAEQAAFGAYGGMRGMDEQRAMANAQLADSQRARNDAFQMGMTQNEMAVRQQQLQAQMQGQGLMAGSQQGAAGINAQVAGQNAGMNSRLLGGTIGLVEDGIGGLTGSGGGGAQPRANGGPVNPGELYLVGERGPELIVPKSAGTVVPAGPTREMLGGAGSRVGLAQLGGPNQVSMGGAAPASFDAIGSGGGMDVTGSLAAHSKFATRFQGDPGGGMMVSDDRAKLRDHERQAYLLGRAHGMEKNQDFAYGGAPRENEEIVDRDPWRSSERMAEQRPEWLDGYMHEQGGNSSRAGVAMGMDPLSDRAGGLMRRGTEMGGDPGRGSRAGDFYAAQPDMAGAAGDRMTSQLARGLAPAIFEYKQGFGTPGTKMGPIAQDMASNDATATAVRQDPSSGLLGIDRDDGLKVALGGVGHLAAKQAKQEELIAALLADRNRPNRRY